MKFIFTRKKVMAWFIGSLLVLSTIPFVTKAVRTDVSRDFPVYNNHGQPDLTVDPKRFVSQMQIMDRFFDASSCELVEGSVGGTGYRRLLRFRSEEHTSELQSHSDLVCRLLLEKKNVSGGG